MEGGGVGKESREWNGADPAALAKDSRAQSSFLGCALTATLLQARPQNTIASTVNVLFALHRSTSCRGHAAPSVDTVTFLQNVRFCWKEAGSIGFHSDIWRCVSSWVTPRS